MKMSIRYVFLAFLSFASLALRAQDREIELPDRADTARKTVFFNENQGYRTFGLNGGFSYQSSDVRNNWDGWGIGATYAKNLLHRQGNLLDLDYRFRGLYANSSGLDGKPSRGILNNEAINGTRGGMNYKPDSLYFANYRNDMFELGLEGVFTFNRLRETKGILFQLYGGVGINGHIVKIDQLNAQNQKYNYRAINQNQSISAIRNEVRSGLDGTYETNADGMLEGPEITLSRNLGVELGFHVTPKFMLSLGHRVTFTNSDIFDGQRWTDANVLGARKDLHHYTSLDLKWILGEKKVTPKRPIISILTPNDDPHTTNRPTQDLVAEILHVRAGVDQVTLTLNGQRQEFTFYGQRLSTVLNLRKGVNEVIVRATNSVGSAEERTTILYQDDVVVAPNQNNNPNTNNPPPPPPPPPSIPRPSVQIVRPQNNTTSEYADVAMRADFYNVQSRNDVNLTINGMNDYDFDFGQGNISRRVQLQEGANRIVVSVRNQAGTASDEVTVYYRRPQQTQRPTVRITDAPNSNSNGTYCSTSFTASVSGVTSSNDVEVLLNGSRVYNFSYQNQAVRGDLSLQNGTNRLRVIARNQGGESYDEVNIQCTTQPRDLPKNPPTVTITEPANGAVPNPSAVLRATVRNATQEQITVRLNGQPVRFTYFSGNQTLTATLADLREGNNEVVVSATTPDGSAQDSRNLVYKKPVVEVPRPPKVTILQPINGTSVAEPSVNVRATIANISDPRGISMSVNGQPFSAYRLDKSNVSLTARVDNLREGENTISIAATNKDGSDAGSVKVVYTRRKTPPTVQITNPANGTNSTRATAGLTATVGNVAAKADIAVLLNGRPIGFELIGTVVRGGLSLQVGDNSIEVVARNADGEARDRVTIKYTPPVPVEPAGDGRTGDGNGSVDTGGGTPTDVLKPIVAAFSVTRPILDPMNPQATATATLTAMVQNAYSADSEVTLFINDVQVIGLNWNRETGMVSHGFQVTGGTTYKVVLRARNAGGSVEKSETLRF